MTEQVYEKDVLDEMIEEESSGGGYIGQAMFFSAWKAFVSQTSNKENTFLVKTKADKISQREAAMAFIREHGLDPVTSGSGKNLEYVIGWILKKDSVLNYANAVNWQDDRYFIYATWTEAGKIVNARRRDVGVGVGDTIWCRMGSMEDPYRKSDGEPKMEKFRNADGTEGERPRRITFAVERFESKEKAQEAAASSGQDTSDVPSKWLEIGGTPEAWRNEAVPEIKKLHGEGRAIPNLATTYGVTVGDIQAVLGN